MKIEKLTKEDLLNQIKEDLQKRWENRNNEHLSSEKYKLNSKFMSRWMIMSLLFEVLLGVIIIKSGLTQRFDERIVIVILFLLFLVCVPVFFRSSIQKRWVSKRIKPLSPLDMEAEIKKQIESEVTTYPEEIIEMEKTILDEKERYSLLLELQKGI